MLYEYKVGTFVPTIKGCGSADMGWDEKRCEQFQIFLNDRADQGWKLNSYDYRQVTLASGCGGGTGIRLVCIFEREKS